MHTRGLASAIHKSRDWPLRMRVVVLVVMTAVVWVLLVTVAVANLADTYVTVAAGKFGAHTWNLGVAASYPNKRCYDLSLRDRGYGSVTACESNDRPHTPWRRVAGVAGETAALELDVTSSNVRYLRLLLGHPGLRKKASTWRLVRTRKIGAVQSARAGLEPIFRFAVLTGRGDLWVEKVVAFGRTGNVIEKLSVPCEF